MKSNSFSKRSFGVRYPSIFLANHSPIRKPETLPLHHNGSMFQSVNTVCHKHLLFCRQLVGQYTCESCVHKARVWPYRLSAYCQVPHQSPSDRRWYAARPHPVVPLCCAPDSFDVAGLGWNGSDDRLFVVNQYCGNRETGRRPHNCTVFSYTPSVR